MTHKKRLLTKVKVIDRKTGGCEQDDETCVPVQTLEDYFALPKHKRIRWGFWYKMPEGLTEEDWDMWPAAIAKDFPIQSWFREWVLSYDNPIYAFIDRTRRDLSDAWYQLKCYFNPKHQAIRNAIPNTWTDISVLIVDVNFAMIKDFYYGEVVNGRVVWNATPSSKKFLLWIKKAIKYIEKDRPQLLKDIDEAYPKVKSLKDNYKSLYNKVDRLEVALWKKDTNLLKQMVDYRDYFWT